MKAEGHDVFYGAVATPGQELVIGCNYASTLVFDLRTGEVRTRLPGAWRIALSPAGERLAFVYNGIHVFDPRSGERVVTLERGDEHHRSVGWVGHDVIVGTPWESGALRLWDAKTGELRFEDYSSEAPILNVATLADGSLAAVRDGAGTVGFSRRAVVDFENSISATRRHGTSSRLAMRRGRR